MWFADEYNLIINLFYLIYSSRYNLLEIGPHIQNEWGCYAQVVGEMQVEI